MSLRLRPLASLREAQRFVVANHSHNREPQGWKFGTAAWDGDSMAGIGIAGRPTAPRLDDGTAIEITRVCTLGRRNACSMIYAALCRASLALGYDRIYTYTLESECATCVRAAGFTRDANVAADTHNRPSRARVEVDLFGQPTTPEGPKVRWIRRAHQ